MIIIITVILTKQKGYYKLKNMLPLINLMRLITSAGENIIFATVVIKKKTVAYRILLIKHQFLMQCKILVYQSLVIKYS